MFNKRNNSREMTYFISEKKGRRTGCIIMRHELSNAFNPQERKKIKLLR